MSLRFRNRLKVFPGIYLNLGKNGISTTIGPRGANINIGKNGVYSNTGIPGSGISNRENLLKFNSNSNKPSIDINTIPAEKDDSMIDNNKEVVTSQGLKGLKEHLEDSRNEGKLLSSEIIEIESTVKELQSDFSKKKNGLFSLFTKKETLDNLQQEINENIENINVLKKQYEDSKADVNIQFDREIELQYKKLCTSFSDLITSNKIWDITSEIQNYQLRSTAKSVVERKEVKFKSESIDFIKSDFSAFHLQNANGSDLYIYPAFVLLINAKGDISLIDLKELSFTFHEQRFEEAATSKPLDSKIIDYTWYKANKDGSRDLRYTGNYQIPVVTYGAFDFKYNSGSQTSTDSLIVRALTGSLKVAGSANDLNETYYISSVDKARNFAEEFKKYLDLIVQKPNEKTTNLDLFSKQYYDLLIDFKATLTSFSERLSADSTLFDKLGINSGKIPSKDFICNCILYDLCQIIKIICKGKIDVAGLEITGLVLLSSKLLKSANVLDWNYQTISNAFASGLYKNIAESLVEVSNTNNPISITINSKLNHQDLNNPQQKLTLPLALKVINHPLFDEYVTLLNHFANIISKANNTVSKEEEETLKEIYQITHNPLPTEENKSVKVSPVSENETLTDVLNELESLIGLNAVKQEVKTLINYIKVQKEREKVGLKSSDISYHCVFTGSPGTGKTTVARIVAKIYMHLGILKKGHLVETDRSGLIAEYTGQTAVKVNNIVDSALNGVLFIDEAYSLIGQNKDDFGREAVATLIKRMEDDRDKLIVILAGYTQEMKAFIDSNPGLESRFNRYIQFPDYSAVELTQIFKLNCNKLDYKLTDDADKRLLQVMTTAFASRDKSFGNGRFARNLFEKTIENQANRIAALTSLTKEILTSIEVEDLPN
jgi:AAA+ superfamily predicted ATPase